MKHLNDNLLCVVTGFVTGPDPKRDDLIQICIAPLTNHYGIHPKIIPFTTNLRQRRFGIDVDYLKQCATKIQPLLKTAVDPDRVADLFEIWFNRHVHPKKKIMVIAYNWNLLGRFYEDWLGYEHFLHYFDYRVRDLVSSSIYLNDRTERQCLSAPIPKHDFGYIANCCDVHYLKSFDAPQQAFVMAEVYKNMLGMFAGV